MLVSESWYEAALMRLLSYVDNMKAQECACCGVTQMPPRWPSTRTQAWSDACACSDYSLCAFHRLEPTTAPKRPTADVLIEGATTSYRKQAVEFARKWARIGSDLQLKVLVEELDRACTEQDKAST